MRCTGLTGHRHQAAWAVAGIDTRPTAMLRDTRVARGGGARWRRRATARTRWPTTAPLGLTLKRHPLALLRPQLAELQDRAGGALRTFPHGRLARASGLVTHRQRPETAKGTVFVTLEDETGAVNVIVWPRSPRRSGSRCSARRCSPSTASGSARARATRR